MELKLYDPSKKAKNPKKRDFLFAATNGEKSVWLVETWDEEGPIFLEQRGFQIIAIYELPELEAVTPPSTTDLGYSHYQQLMEDFWYNK